MLIDMPPTIFARPVLPTEATTAPAGSGWAHSVDTVTTWAHTTPTWAWTIPLAALLALSIRGRRKRAKTEKTGAEKAAITRTDRAITRITGLIATAVLAQGMWVFFTDVLHLPPALRLVLFAFVEFQIISTWRRALRTLHRHGHLGTAVRSVYLLAFGSALIASWHAATAQLGGFRWFVAFVAAYMIVEELVEERDIFLTANPTYKTNPKTARANRRINWAITPERVLVWLRLAEPAERAVADVERQRRVARFARTAHRLDLLKESRAWTWRIALARRSLRRQTEAAIEHLNLAADQHLVRSAQTQLALLYTVEEGTTRDAVRGMSPMRRQAERHAIAAAPFHLASGEHRWPAKPATVATGEVATGHANQPATPASPVVDTNTPPVADNRPDTVAATGHANQAPALPPHPRQPRAERVANTDASGSAPEAARKLAKWVAKYPDATNAELAKRAKCSERTVSRYRATAEAINLANSRPEAGEEGPRLAPLMVPFQTPIRTATPALNGHAHTTKEN